MLQSFCAGDFWNLNVTWYSSTPDFPYCFHQTALVWIPIAVLAIVAPFEFLENRKEEKRKIIWTWQTVSKISLNVTLMLPEIAELVYFIVESFHSEVYPADYLAGVLKLISGFCKNRNN